MLSRFASYGSVNRILNFAEFKTGIFREKFDNFSFIITVHELGTW